MPAFFEYLRNITYYLMFATVAGMITPSGKYKKFVTLILGFILLALMIRPLIFFSDEILFSDWFAESVPASADIDFNTSFANWQDTYLREIFEEQIENQLFSLLEDEGFTVYFLDFSYRDDFSRLTEVNAVVSRDENTVRIPLIRIIPPSFNNEPEEQEDCPVTKEVKNLISQFYNLDSKHINVIVN